MSPTDFCSQWLQFLDETEAERYAAEVDKEDNEEVREMVITWEETIAASEARGGLVAMRNSILRVLDRRLGSVPSGLRQKLDGIGSLERLEEILDQALTVSSVADLGLEAEPSS